MDCPGGPTESQGTLYAKREGGKWASQRDQGRQRRNDTGPQDKELEEAREQILP